MDLETRRRIRAYKKALPELRERVVAVALLLAMSVSMLTSASFAWLTLSRNPEVSAISTTVTANGNLEIALAQGDGQTAPAESQVGDSSSRQSVVEANKTWGNLINLNDASYGLDAMELRPAKLNDASLANSPLWGSVYAEDGRITTLDSRYTYTMWNPTGKEFVATKDYGVRAIASYTTGTSGEQTAVYDAIVMRTVNAHNDANNAYKESLRDDKIGSLSTLMSNYVQIQADKMLGGGADADVKVEQADISNMHSLYSGYLGAVKLAAQAKVELANLQQYIYATNHEGASYTPVTWEDLVANQNLFDSKGSGHKTNPTSAREAISLTGLKQFITDYNTMASDFEAIEDYKNNYAAYGTINYNTGGKTGKNIGDIVSRLVDPASAHLVKGSDKIVIGKLTTSDATKLMNYDGPVVVNNGILARMELNFVEQSFRVSQGGAGYTGKITLTAKALGFPVTIKGTVCTAATDNNENCHYSVDFAKTTEMDLSGSEKIAEDTYGLAIDFWVRTNAAQTYLTLEGKLDKTTELVRVTGTDGSGNQVDLYTVTITRSDNEFEVDVYSKDSKWYYAGTNTEVSAEEMGENTPAAKNREVTTVHGYSGENRVWENAENDALLTAESTTQGNGSCYIYYADTPEDMQHSLSLLNAMKVAFISGPDLLATASMDTEHYYAVNGRVTVPMKLDALSGVNTGTVDEEGNPVYGITPLVQNEAHMITALVYLDGTMLGNDNVLAASAIGGQLNIQFGSSQPLTTVGDENLKDDIRTVTASVSETEFDYMDYLDGEKLTTYVNVKVDGDNPNQVTAFFQRAINATQGTRQETMTFTKQEDGSWQAAYDFTAPGDYYLRTVRMDGIDYPLEEPCKVTVKGFALQSVDWGESTSQATKYLLESYYDESISVAFASSSSYAQPKTVAARFIEENGNSVNIDLKLNATTQRWEGTGRFISSGTYYLNFLILDGEYYDASAFTKTLTLYMGLTTRVENAGSTLQDKYESGKTYSKNVNVYIYDNSGNILKNLMDARLEYSRGGDSTDTVNIPVEWDGSVYRGTMPLTNPGRYAFYSVHTGSGILTRATESPVYVIASPDVPKYDRTSISNYHNALQFAPFTYDAYIGPVKISNAASVAAVVYNDAVEKNFLIPQEDMSYNAQLDAWIMNLPTYYLDSDLDDKGIPLPSAVERQAGTWTVKQIMVWDCYDESGTFHDSENPIVWVHGEGYDFSLLSTTVSDSVKVAMNAGTTELGKLSTPFMTAHDVADLGMYVELTDNDGNVIPAEKVSDIKLNLSYTDNTDIANYGYVVSGYSRDVQVKLNQQDAATGHWQFSDAGSTLQTMQYVGQYKVDSLVVTMKGGKVLTYYPGANGIPSTYTVKSAAPTADNLSIKSLKQGSTVFGKNGDTVVGEFLASYNPGVEVELALVYTDDQGNTKDAAYARVEGVDVSLKLTYQDGKKAPNGGGYTWSGTSQYETIDLPMTLQAGGYRYKSGSSPMLAGTYSLNGTITVNGSSKSIGVLNNISVYSVKPTVKVTGVTPGVTDKFLMNKNTATDINSRFWVMVQGEEVQNYMSDYLANVYIKAEQYAGNVEDFETIKYTAPEVELTLSNAGNSFQNAQLVVPNSSDSQYESVYTFTQAGMKQTAVIGQVSAASDIIEANDSACGGDTETKYDYYEKYEAGEQTISWIIMTDDDGTAYTVYLNHDLTIREENTAPPSISFVDEAGYTTPAGMSSVDGGEFVFTLPSSIGTTNATIPEINDDGDWGTPSDSIQYLCYVKNGPVQYNPVETKQGCETVTTNYAYCQFTYYLYERHQYTYEKTAVTTTYEVVRGVKGWNIGGVTYAPGQTITVDSAVTAKPIIGELDRRLIDTKTATIVHTTRKDVEATPPESYSTGDMKKTTNPDEAKKDYKLPQGYNWFNVDDPFDHSSVNTNEVQVGDDYTKTES